MIEKVKVALQRIPAHSLQFDHSSVALSKHFVSSFYESIETAILVSRIKVAPNDAQTELSST
jgi:hypothetical protein